MNKILIVHGVGYQFSGEHQVHAAYSPAILDGLGLAGATLHSANIAAPVYGDLFRLTGIRSAGLPPLSAEDVDPFPEGELLRLFWQEAARTDEGVLPPEAQTRARTPQFVQRALDALSQSSFFAKIAEQALIFDFRQVALYFSNDSLRRATQARIADRVTPNTRVVVAHSLGSVVAYEALCANPHWGITTLVTLGSPLGIANLIFHKLQPRPENGQGRWPSSLRRWTNIADQGDVVALQKQLAPLFCNRVRDLLVHNGAHAHDATRYLTAKETGEAIAEGLGD